jgi:hypothetical protein
MRRLLAVLAIVVVALIVSWEAPVSDVPGLTRTVTAAQAPAPPSASAIGGDLAAPADVAAPPADADRRPSGLVSKIVTPGVSTEKPTPTDVVTVHYSGWTADGKLFESSRPRGTPTMLSLNRSLPGWRECVPLMTVGETPRLAAIGVGRPTCRRRTSANHPPMPSARRPA